MFLDFEQRKGIYDVTNDRGFFRSLKKELDTDIYVHSRLLTDVIVSDLSRNAELSAVWTRSPDSTELGIKWSK